MSQAFDILPPEKKENSPTPAVEKRRGRGIINIVLIILILVVSGFVLSNLNRVQNQTPTNSSKDKSQLPNFELFNSEGTSNLTDTSIIKIRVLNASGRSEEIDKTKTVLTQAGWTIEQASQTQDLYTQTFIKYSKENANKAVRVNAILAKTYQTRMEESPNLGNMYDVLVIIGQK